MKRILLLSKLALVTLIHGVAFLTVGDRDIVRNWCNRILRIMGVRVVVRGRVPLKPCVVVSNHRSYVDPLVLTSVLPDHPVWVVKSEVLKWPLIGKGLRKYGAVFVDRASPRRAAISVVRFFSGMKLRRSVVVFPEGTRGNVGELKKGAFVLAKKLKFPLLPVRLWNTGYILKPGSMYPRPGVVYVEVFDPIMPYESVDDMLKRTEELLL